MGNSRSRRGGVIALAVAAALTTFACGSARPQATGGEGQILYTDGTCLVDGARRECSFTVPSSGMLVCGKGWETCRNGSWTACSGDERVAYPGVTYDPADDSAPLKIEETLATAALVSATPSTCLNNPCSPDCLAVTLPGAQLCGLVSEKPRDSYNDLAVGYRQQPVTCNPLADRCGYDSYCRASDSTCRFIGKRSTCTGVDFTVGAACDPKQGSLPDQIPLCNRGTVDATSGLLKVAWTTATPPLDACQRLTVPAASTCTIDLAATPIKAKSCIDIDSNRCPGLPASGDVMMVVNDDGAGGARLPECNTCNNWAGVDVATTRGCSLSCNLKDDEGNDINYNQLPGGFQQNPVTCTVMSAAITATSGATPGADANNTPPADNCNYDFKCAGGTCASFGPSESGHCTGVDLTGGVGCKNGDVKGLRFPICNRGTQTLTNATIQVGLDPGTNGPLYCTNQVLALTGGVAGVGSVSPVKDGICPITIASLPPGECITFDSASLGCPASFKDGGNERVYIDATNVVAECDECNNWSAFSQSDKCGQNPPSQTIDLQIPSSCPPGYVARWGKLFYATTTPAGSSIVFRAQTGPSATGPWLPAAAATVADIPATDANVCAKACASGSCAGPYAAPFTSVTGSTPAVCPKDLTAPLGTAAKGAFLNLTITLTAKKGDDANKIPVLDAPPQVMFDCVPNE